MISQEQKKWQKERNEAVASLDVETFKAFYEKWKRKGFYAARLPRDEVLEISIRKMAIAIEDMDEEVKAKARKWLSERGYHGKLRE